MRVFGVHQRDDGVQLEAGGHLVVDEEGLCHRAGVGHTRGLDDHPLEVQFTLAALFGQVGQRGTQVFSDGAADAAVAHLDDLLLGVGHQDVVVDILFAELVFDDGDLLTVGFSQHPLEQGRLARSQEAGEDGGGNQ